VWRLTQILFSLWLIQAVRKIRRQGATIMADQLSLDDQVEQLRLAVDTETNRLADLFEQKAAQIGNRLGDRETASLKQWLGDHAARLRQIGSDGANPVPSEPPQPATPAAPGTPPDATGDATGGTADAGSTPASPATTDQPQGGQ
jgi:hypothetical protein